MNDSSRPSVQGVYPLNTELLEPLMSLTIALFALGFSSSAALLTAFAERQG